MKRLVMVALVAALVGCRSQAPVLSEAERAAIADSVGARVRAAFEGFNRLEIGPVIADFAADADVRILENGMAYPSLDQYRQTWDSIYGSWASLSSTPTEVRVVVLGPEAAAATTPFAFTIRTKRGRTVEGRGVGRACGIGGAGPGRSCSPTSRSPRLIE